MRAYSLILFSVLFLATACERRSSFTSERSGGGSPETTRFDEQLVGDWELEQPEAVTDARLPKRLRYLINANRMGEMHFCALNGVHGFTSLQIPSEGPRHFEYVARVLPPDQIDLFRANVTRVDNQSLQLNSAFNYRRVQFTLPNTNLCDAVIN